MTRLAVHRRGCILAAFLSASSDFWSDRPNHHLQQDYLRHFRPRWRGDARRWIQLPPVRRMGIYVGGNPALGLGFVEWCVGQSRRGRPERDLKLI